MANSNKEHGIVEECAGTMMDCMKDAFADGNKRVECEISTRDGYITIKADADDNLVVSVFHDIGKGCHPTPNLTKAIRRAIPLWSSAYDAWQEEKELEEEELRCEYGGTLDPAFGSWEDFNHYMYG